MYPDGLTAVNTGLLWRVEQGSSCAVTHAISCDSKLLTCSILIPLFIPLFRQFSQPGCRAAVEVDFEDDVHNKTRSKFL